MSTTFHRLTQQFGHILPKASGKVRVRIAPSPTGPLHIGTARTALFNYLFAKKNRGTFVLRIEDTDLERSDVVFEKDIMEHLRWLGLDWDEGVEVGGSFGPYRQSERISRYEKAAKRLLDADRAYLCFCSVEELEINRKQQRKKGEAPRYSGKCRTLLCDESIVRAGKGERALLRLRMPDEKLTFKDLIRGAVTFSTELFGDIAIAKMLQPENGRVATFSPLYNFAVVIDDSEMAITHVLRGEDHISNTPKQIVIAQALGFSSPEFGHMPLVLGADKAKLSKRHGATTVKEFRELGYHPEALVNFLAMLGWNPGTEQDVFTLEQLVSSFTIEHVNQSGAIWDQGKLDWYNHTFSRRDLALRRKDAPIVTPELLKRAKSELIRQHWKMNEASLSEVVMLTTERKGLQKLEELLSGEYKYFFVRPIVSAELLLWRNMSKSDAQDSLLKVRSLLEPISEKNWKRGYIESVLLASAGEEIGANGKVDRGRLLWPLRVALSGAKRSPGPFEIAAIIGKEETLERTDVARATLS